MSYWTNKSIAVTGACGMIGSHLCKLLVDAGTFVIAIDNLERGKLQNLTNQYGEICDHIAFHEADCSDLDEVRFIFSRHRVDTVLNLAAKVTAIDYNSSHHGEMFFKNMQLQSIPLEAARLAGVKRFLQCSTVCVYPHTTKLPTQEYEACANNPEPTNEGYGLAKLMGERLAQFYAFEYDIELAITRFANAYGERDYFDWETSHVIPSLIRKNLEHDVVEIWGDGEQRREFLYAKDAALGIMKAAEMGAGQGAINIGTGYNISMNELNTKIQDILGIHKPVKHIFTKPTGHLERLADNTKLRQLTGWTPETTLEDGLKRTIKWYQESLSL